ncbi:MAG: CDP-diacylglycerol--serine O-phosphatidyltransferase, partial [Selenomonas sp.]|nr:CDP-diacylglycerol--serine O-phosphatidyltransferase [Selenomonas sp.]
TTLLFVTLGVDPLSFGVAYPIIMAIVGYLMVSHVHYPNFKGDGAEPIYLVTKIFALVMFAAILWFGKDALLPAVAVAVFCPYGAAGILNTVIALFAKEG